MTILDRRDAYEYLVKPKVKELFDLCKRYDVPFINLTISFADPEGEGYSILRNSQVLPTNPSHLPDAMKLILAFLNDEEFAEAALQLLVLRAVGAVAAQLTHAAPTTKQ